MCVYEAISDCEWRKRKKEARLGQTQIAKSVWRRSDASDMTNNPNGYIVCTEEKKKVQ